MEKEITNFFVTGAKGVGKSTLLQQVVKELQIGHLLYGFQTLPYYNGNERKGFYMHSLQPIANNDLPISIQDTSYSCETILETFETLGVEILNQCLREEVNYVFLDEIGVLESKAELFKMHIENCLKSPKCVIGVLKEKDHPFIQDIIKRDDTRVYKLTKDNTELNIEKVKKQLQASIKYYMKEGKK